MPGDSGEAFEAFLENENLRAVFRHWNDARGARAMPARAEIDPHILGRALPSVWIYERDGDGEFTCRLAGEAINSAHKQSIMRRPAREIFGPDYDGAIRQRMNFVLDTPAVLFGSMSFPAENRSVARISLPLSDQAGRPTFTFGASEYIDLGFQDMHDPPLVGRVDNLALFSTPDFVRMDPAKVF